MMMTFFCSNVTSYWCWPMLYATIIVTTIFMVMLERWWTTLWNYSRWETPLCSSPWSRRFPSSFGSLWKRRIHLGKRRMVLEHMTTNRLIMVTIVMINNHVHVHLRLLPQRHRFEPMHRQSIMAMQHHLLIRCKSVNARRFLPSNQVAILLWRKVHASSLSFIVYLFIFLDLVFFCLSFSVLMSFAKGNHSF